MRIAFVYDAVYPYKIGGVEKRIWEISRRLARSGHDVHLFCMKLWDGPADIVREGVHFHGISRKMPFYVGKDGRRAVFPAMWFSIALLAPLLRCGRFDVIDCQNFPYFPCFTSWAVSIARKTPLLITWNEVWGAYWFEYMGPAGFFGRCVERLVITLTDHHSAISPTTRAQMETLGASSGVPVVSCGMDVAGITLVPPSAKASDVICVGRFIRDKHVDILVDAVALVRETMPGIRCIIIGRGPEEERLKAMVMRSGLESNIELIGFARDQEEIITLLKASKMCVLPSTREGFGMVALEALACGIPVITADHPQNAIRDLAPYGDVRIVPLTKEDFAEAICHGLFSPPPSDSAGLRGTWDWDAVTAQWLETALHLDAA